MTSLLLVVIYIAFISLGLPDAIFGSAWPSMYGELEVPVSYAGIITMIISCGTIVSSLFSYRVIRRLGTGLVTLMSVAMTAVALFGFSFATTFWLLCLWSIPYGLGAGSVDAALNNFVALHYKAQHMSWLHCFWGVGATLGTVHHGFMFDPRPALACGLPENRLDPDRLGGRSYHQFAVVATDSEETEFGDAGEENRRSKRSTPPVRREANSGGLFLLLFVGGDGRLMGKQLSGFTAGDWRRNSG